MKQSIGFVGGGRVTRILLQAFKNENAEFTKIVVTDTNKEVTDKLMKLYPDIQVDSPTVTASQDIVFISLHPPVVMDTLDLIKESVKSNAVIVSLAPKITIAKISSKVNGVKNICRLIPNATSFINEGYNPVCFSADFLGNKKQEVLGMLSLAGNTFEVPEEKLESYALISAMLPTYFWFQWKELADIGIKLGLTEKESRASIHETIIASVNLMFKTDMSTADVMDLIPVKPIGEYESQISEIYRNKLPALFEKIKP